MRTSRGGARRGGGGGPGAQLTPAQLAQMTQDALKEAWAELAKWVAVSCRPSVYVRKLTTAASSLLDTTLPFVRGW